MGARDVTGPALRWRAMLFALVMLGACARGTEPLPPEVEGMPSTATPSPTTSATTSPSPAELRVTRDDAKLIDAFVEFAVDTNATTLGRLPLSRDGASLGLGRVLLRELPLSEAHHRSSWRIQSDDLFRGHVGPFSVLDTVRGHVEEGARDAEIRTTGAIQVSLGEHPHCASPPVPPPPGLEEMRRVSMQPADDAITSCLAWFSADLFLDTEGNIVAITLDIWEP